MQTITGFPYKRKDYGYVIVGSVSDYKKKAQVFDLELEDGSNFIVTSSSRGVNARDGGVAVGSV